MEHFAERDQCSAYHVVGTPKLLVILLLLLLSATTNLIFSEINSEIGFQLLKRSRCASKAVRMWPAVLTSWSFHSVCWGLAAQPVSQMISKNRLNSLWSDPHFWDAQNSSLGWEVPDICGMSEFFKKNWVSLTTELLIWPQRDSPNVSCQFCWLCFLPNFRLVSIRQPHSKQDMYVCIWRVESGKKREGKDV